MSSEFQEPNLNGVIDALIDMFGTSQNMSANRDIRNDSYLYSDIFSRMKMMGTFSNSIQASLNGGESGLYALVLANKTELENLYEPSYAASTFWTYCINRMLPPTDDTTTAQRNVDEESLNLSNILSVPEYRVFILSKDQNAEPKPMVTKFGDTYAFAHLYTYPLARVTSKFLKKIVLNPGTLVRVQYENAQNKEMLNLIDVVEDDTIFTQMVMGAFLTDSASSADNSCSTDSEYTGQHAMGDSIGVESEPPPPEPEPESETLAYTQEQLNDIKAADLVLFTSPVVCGACVILEEEYFDIVGITTAQIQMFDPINPKGSGTSGETELPDDNGLYDTIVNNPNQGTGTISLPTLAQYQGGVLTFISEDSASIRSFVKNIAGDK